MSFPYSAEEVVEAFRQHPDWKPAADTFYDTVPQYTVEQQQGYSCSICGLGALYLMHGGRLAGDRDYTYILAETIAQELGISEATVWAFSEGFCGEEKPDLGYNFVPSQDEELLSAFAVGKESRQLLGLTDEDEDENENEEEA